MIRVLSVDDHALMREGLKRILDECEDIKVTGEAGSGEEALRVLASQKFDLVISDLRFRHLLYSHILIVIVNSYKQTGSPETLELQAVPALTCSKSFCASLGV